jgi:hypothetical protein
MTIDLSERQMGLVAMAIDGRRPGFRLVQHGLVLSPDPEENRQLLRTLDRQARGADPDDMQAAGKLVAAIRAALGGSAP